MPRERVYRFVEAPTGQKPATHNFQRTVRSHAASVSHRDHVTRRQPRTRLRQHGEGVIFFDVSPLDHTVSTTKRRPSFLPPSAQVDEPDIIASKSGQRNTGHQSITSSTSLSSNCLLTDYLSGKTFSPLQHLTTYHKPYLPGIVNHYVCNLTVPIPELDGNSAVPLFRAAWLPVVFHDPLIFQVVVLFAATHYATFADPSQYDQLHQELLSLKHSALAALIQKVQNEQAASHIANNCIHTTHDTLIAAAAKMASYEAIFGTTEASIQFHLHMSTVTRLLRLQGGLASLGMNGFLARLLSFIDTNSAFLLGTRLYLVEFGLRNRMPHHQPFPPGGLDDLAPQSNWQTSSTNVVNLERFIGFMNVDDEKSVGEEHH